MSTKIYNGFKVTLPLGQFGFSYTYNFFKEMVENIRVISKEKYVEEFIRSFYHEVDQAVLQKRTADFDNTIYSYEKGEKRGKDRFGFQQRFSGGVTVYSYAGNVYFTHYYDGHVWDEYVKRHAPPIEHFGYWDNTDPDESISEEDWEYRKEVWDNIFPACLSPAETGFSINGHGEYSSAPIPDWSGRVELQPTRADRVEALVEGEILNDKFEEYRDNYLKENNMTLEEFNNSKRVDDYMAVRYKVRNSITEEEKQAKRNFLNLILPEKYTEEQLKKIFGW